MDKRVEITLNEGGSTSRSGTMTRRKEQGQGELEEKVLRSLFDMLDGCGLAYETGQGLSYYENLIGSYEKEGRISSFPELEDRMLLILFEKYDAFPAPDDYMKKIVDRLGGESEEEKEDSLRLRILKRFLQYGNGLADAGYGGSAYIRKYMKEQRGLKGAVKDVSLSDPDNLKVLNDSVFDVLETAGKDKNKTTYALLKAADDLAGGKFREAGATKKLLYFFAMVYNMTYDRGGDTYDPVTDFEKNLFSDYYTNNFMRYLSEGYRNQNAGGFEQDPSGAGINYKNLAEVTYLYYLCQDMPASEKIRRSTDMIRRVQDAGKGRDEKTLPEGKMRTADYRRYFKGGGSAAFSSTGADGRAALRNKLDLSEEEFADFLKNEYPYESGNILKAGAEQQTACQVYQGIVTGLKEEVAKKQREIEQMMQESRNSDPEEDDPSRLLLVGALSEDLLRAPDAPDSGLEASLDEVWFLHLVREKEKTVRRLVRDHPEKKIDPAKLAEFMDLLDRFNEYLSRTPGEGVSAKNVTRNKMITAYYYLYNEMHEDDSPNAGKTFREVFEEFHQGLDPLLEAAYYPPLSSKNIFDVLVCFTAYVALKWCNVFHAPPASKQETCIGRNS